MSRPVNVSFDLTDALLVASVLGAVEAEPPHIVREFRNQVMEKQNGRKAAAKLPRSEWVAIFGALHSTRRQLRVSGPMGNTLRVRLGRVAEEIRQQVRTAEKEQETLT